MADQYGAWSPYNYVLGNPLKYIDPDGMQVDVSDLADNNDMELLLKLMSELSDITGNNVSWSRSSSLLKVSDDCGVECNSRSGTFSSSAEQYVRFLINDDSETLYVKNNSRNREIARDAEGNRSPAKLGGSQTIGNNIFLDEGQIDMFQKSIDKHYEGQDHLSNASETLNTAFVFLHETLHTNFGASYYGSETLFRDPPVGFGMSASPGDVVKRVNVFREELGLPTRTVYSSHSAKSLRFWGEDILIIR